MNFTTENIGSASFLIYKIAENDAIDSLSLGMIKNNSIKGIIPVLFTQADDAKYLKYNVTSKVTAKQFLEGVVSRRSLLGVLSGILEAFLSAQDYMIDSNELILDLSYIFVDVSTCDTVLICLPVESQEAEKTDLNDFFRELVFSCQYDQSENTDYIAQIINFLHNAQTFSVSEFKRLVDSLKNPGAGNGVQQNKTVISASAAPAASSSQNLVNPYKSQTIDRTSAVPASPTLERKVVTPVNNERNIKVPPLPQGSSTEVSKKSGGSSDNSAKKISLLYLLAHYSKENSELYKSQRTKDNKTEVPQGNGTIPPKQLDRNIKIPGQPVKVIQTPSPQNFQQDGQSISSLKQNIDVNAQAGNPPQQNVSISSQPMNYSFQTEAIVTKTGNFGNTTVLAGQNAGQTTVLSETQESANTVVKPLLIRLKTNEKIYINKPVYRIGKEKSYVDYFIGDNSAVSRSHADIISRDGKYYIIDNNSTNHTYINGTMIQSNTQTEIVQGARIRLANEEFDFKIL